MNSLNAISLIPLSISSSTFGNDNIFLGSFLSYKDNDLTLEEDYDVKVKKDSNDIFSEFNLHISEYEKSLAILHTMINLLDTLDEKDLEIQFVSFIEEYQNTKEFVIAVSLLFSNSISYEKQCLFLDILLSSDVDIFVPWYKMALLKAINSNSKTLNFIAKSILKRYSKSFDKVQYVFN